jgi:hypothetical protein
MSFIVAMRKRSLVTNQWGAQAISRIRCADKSSVAAFPAPLTKVTTINVDTAGRELLLSGQKGICVQWR